MKKFLPVIAFLLMVSEAYSQSVGVGISTPHSSAMLDVTSTAKGLLPPRMNTSERIAIATPANGLIVYDTDLSGLMLYSANSWKALSTATGGSATGIAFKAVAGNQNNGLTAYNAFLKLPAMNINTLGYNVGTALSNDGKAIFTAPSNGIYHFDVRLHFIVDQGCSTNYSIRFLKNGSVSTDADKNGRLIFNSAFDMQEANCTKDFMLNAGNTIEVEYLINVPSPVPGNFNMVGSVGNITSAFTGYRVLSL